MNGITLEQAEKLGVQFQVWTPVGLATLSVEGIYKLKKLGMAGFTAELTGISADRVEEWMRYESITRCQALTGKGHPCKNSKPWQKASGEMITVYNLCDLDFYCTIHRGQS